MQEFYEFMEQRQYFIGNDLYAKYHEMLEKEKEVIMDAHHCGRIFENKYPEPNKPYNALAEQYYNETFNTKEK